MKIDRKRDPNINRGTDETIADYMVRISEYMSKLEWQSEGHRMWYTHKNPYSCWICELLQIGRSLEAELMDIGYDTGRISRLTTEREQSREEPK